jgi:hypothetical protein
MCVDYLDACIVRRGCVFWNLAAVFSHTIASKPMTDCSFGTIANATLSIVFDGVA